MLQGARHGRVQSGGGGGGSSSDSGGNGRSRSCGPPGGGSSRDRRSQSSVLAGTQPQICHHFRRGLCRFGSSCRFSHDPRVHAAAALPFIDRQVVHSEANISTAVSAVSAALPAAAPWRFRVLSYNILADHLAHEHAAELYSSAPHFSLRWSYRSGLILREILHHRPDVVCLQEVDHFRQLQEELRPHGYEGIYIKRTGDRRDGLAMFWRSDSVCPVKQRTICFRDFGLKDNVAQLVAFQRLSDAADASNPSSSEGSAGSLSGHKRRQADLEPSSRSTSVPIHLRFTDSDSESEDDGDGVSRRAQIAKRRGVVPRAAAAMALEACSIQDVVPIQPSRAGAAPGRGGGGEAAAAAGRRNSSSVWMGIEVQAATQPAEEDADVAPAVQQPRLPSLVVANIHVLFNPRRGDMKMGQVRHLLEQVDSLCLQQQKITGLRAAAIVCGDFNSATGSPIYEFVRNGKLELSLHDRRRMSGQVECSGGNWRSLQHSFLAQQRQQQQGDQQQEHWQQGGTGAGLRDAWPGQPPALLIGAAAVLPAILPPYAPPEANNGGRTSSSSSSRGLRPWSAEDVRLAAGSSHGGTSTARHPLQLESAYRAVTGREAAYSTCHDKFIGCVDYMWFTPGSSNAAPWRLLPLSVLPPPPLETLHCALPSPAWPSDHISLVCDYALLPGAMPAQ